MLEPQSPWQNYVVDFTGQKPVNLGPVNRKGINRWQLLAAGGATIAGLVAGTTILWPKDSPSSNQTALAPTGTPLPSPTALSTRAIESATPANTTTALPTATRLPTKTAEEIAVESARREAGTTNIAEYLLEDWVNQFRANRLERISKDPASRERIDPELLKSRTINFVILGLDQSRARCQAETGSITECIQGFGRSDTIIVASFDPHTFKTKLISIPRDIFTPEVESASLLPWTTVSRMNFMTVKPTGEDQYSFIRRIIESATGLPVDGITKINLDFITGFDDNGRLNKGFIDLLFPEGIDIDVKADICDDVMLTTFKQGIERMNGKRLLEYIQTRQGTSQDQNFASYRGSRHIEVIQTLTKASISRVMVNKPTSTVDQVRFYAEMYSKMTRLFSQIIDSLDVQTKSNTFFSDNNVIALLRNIKDKIPNISLIPGDIGRIALLGYIALNSNQLFEKIKNDSSSFFTLRELNPINGDTVWTDPTDLKYSAGLQKVAGSSTISQKTSHGNYLDYWRPFRQKIKQMFV